MNIPKDDDGHILWDQINFLKWQVDEKYRVRLIHKPARSWRAYYIGSNGKLCFVTLNETLLDSGYSFENFLAVPKAVYSINVIDRRNGKLTVMEGPIEIFRSFRQFFEITGIEPGSASAPDFCITTKPPLPMWITAREATRRIQAIDPNAPNCLEMEQQILSLIEPYPTEIWPMHFETHNYIDNSPFTSDEKTTIVADFIDISGLVQADTRETIESVMTFLSTQKRRVCPDCRGTKVIKLFTSVQNCKICDENGTVPA